MRRKIHMLQSIANESLPRFVRTNAGLEVGSSLAELGQVGGRLLSARVELIHFEAKAAFQRTLSVALLMLIGMPALICGWIALMIGGAGFLERHLPAPLSVMLVGITSALVGLIFVFLGVRKGVSRDPERRAAIEQPNGECRS
jgi:hypothetical protein